MQNSSMDQWVQELHFPDLDIPITINNIYSVTPSRPIPAAYGDRLYLSNLDDMVGTRVLTPTIYFYPKNGSTFDCHGPVGKIMGEALAHVLVPYYPFSGRLRETINGKLEVFFGPNQGALMVVAQSSMALDELGNLVVPNPCWSSLIYRFPDEGPYKVVDMPLVIAQVTSFRCGGFSLGLRLCHCLCDGLGAMQFVSAWAAMARLGPMATIEPEPCWDRDSLKPRNPPAVTFPHPEFERVEDSSSLGATLHQAKLVQKCYWVSREFQLRLKELAQKEGEEACTSFDSMAAHIWCCWARALTIEPLDFKLRLTFSVNIRPMLKDPPLRAGFYGNALSVACARSTVARLLDDGLAATAQLIHAARAGVTEEYVRSGVDYIEVNRPKQLEFAGKLTITQWTRFPMYQSADFGWGMPVYAGPIDLTPTPQVCVLLPAGQATVSGPMVVWICLPEDATKKFTECLLKP